MMDNIVHIQHDMKAAMHVGSVLQTAFASVLLRLDQRNVRTLIQAVCACLSGRQLSLMALARHWPGASQATAPLKRLDRWLSNRSVQAVRWAFYQAAANRLVRQRYPVVIVDWSELPRDGRWQLLRASIARKGRALTLYEEVHPQRRLGARRVHTHFLQRLHAILPAGCQPIVVTDAGFHTPWFRAVESLGWYWLGRVRGRMRIQLDQPEAPWRPVSDYYARASGRAESLGPGRLTASRPTRCRLVRLKRPPQGRTQKRRDGRRASGGTAREMARRHRDPWVLVCSPDLTYSAQALVRIYSGRMAIETAFRDLKAHQYGCAFEDTQTYVGARLEMLLLIHMLATLVAWLAAIASASQHETRFRLSLLRRGWEWLRQTHHTLPGVRQPPWQALSQTLLNHATIT